MSAEEPPLARLALGAFEPAEHRRRAEALQARMGEAGLDALWLSSAADVFYLTGFLTRFWESPTRPWFVALPASGDPIALAPSIGAAPLARVWPGALRTWPSPNPKDEGLSALAETLAEMTPPSGRIGAPFGPETRLGAPLRDVDGLRARLAPRAFVDATALLREARLVKSEAEIARVRAACAAAAAALKAPLAVAAPGVSLAEVFRRTQIAALAAGADWVGYLAGAAGPGGYEDVISSAADERLAVGDVLLLDIGVVSGGYYCDFGRNYGIGAVSEEARRAYAALCDAADAAIAAARPGAAASDLHRVMAQAIESAGFAPLDGRFGHGLGLTLTEPPSLAAHDQTVLPEGAVLAIEPGLALSSGRIMVHEENIVLRAGAAERLSPPAPDRLPEIA